MSGPVHKAIPILSADCTPPPLANKEKLKVLASAWLAQRGAASGAQDSLLSAHLG